jgi:hypothetical protein
VAASTATHLLLRRRIHVQSKLPLSNDCRAAFCLLLCPFIFIFTVTASAPVRVSHVSYLIGYLLTALAACRFLFTITAPARISYGGRSIGHLLTTITVLARSTIRPASVISSQSLMRCGKEALDNWGATSTTAMGEEGSISTKE